MLIIITVTYNIIVINHDLSCHSFIKTQILYSISVCNYNLKNVHIRHTKYPNFLVLTEVIYCIRLFYIQSNSNKEFYFDICLINILNLFQHLYICFKGAIYKCICN